MFILSILVEFEPFSFALPVAASTHAATRSAEGVNLITEECGGRDSERIRCFRVLLEREKHEMSRVKNHLRLENLNFLLNVSLIPLKDSNVISLECMALYFKHHVYDDECD